VEHSVEFRSTEALAFSALLSVHVLPALHEDATFSSPNPVSVPLFKPATELAIEVLPGACESLVTDSRRRRRSVEIGKRLIALLKARLAWLGSAEHEEFERHNNEDSDAERKNILQVETPHIELTRCCRALGQAFLSSDLSKSRELGKNLGLFFSMLISDNDSDHCFESTSYAITDQAALFSKRARKIILRHINSCTAKFVDRRLTRLDIIRAWNVVEVLRLSLNNASQTKEVPPKASDPLGQRESGARLTWDKSDVPHWGNKPFGGARASIKMLKILVNHDGKVTLKEIIEEIKGTDWLRYADDATRLKEVKMVKTLVQTAMSRLREDAKKSWKWGKDYLPDAKNKTYSLGLAPDSFDKPSLP
jgi:hypothetical protein